ncbi:ABC transporter ATP-binding protein [Halobaculum sp. MBLA0147]|uniref:ABC transporter ATP-binding protein n=1 Tax=Halobaculum sp. MBLA0147 TaxID=3079934 RepID=UPI0035237D68
MSETGAIVTEGLGKRYGDTEAVSALELSIDPGTVYGFLGPNGAGKTTTMRMLTTLTRPSHGTAHVAGQPVSDREAVVERIGYLPEEPPLFDELTAREQLEYTAGLRDLESAAADRIDELLARLDLAADADRRIDEYSKGMKQKTGIVQAMLHEPDVLFLDEPTSGLDPRASRTVRDTIAELSRGDTTVFLSTHILPVVDELADVVGVLADGELVAEGPPETLKRRAAEGDERTLEDVFLDVTGGSGEERTDLVGEDVGSVASDDEPAVETTSSADEEARR